MSDMLEKICADKRIAVEKAKILRSFDRVNRDALRAPLPRGFIRALREGYEKDGMGFVTELKKASPSAGLIRPLYSPSALAKTFADAGASCLSVVTDEAYFQGSNQDLIDARAACGLPVMHRDFILDVWQVAEARAIGADCIVVIMAIVDDATASALHHAATGYGMDVLIEIHNRDELTRALKLPSRLIGINSRNLKSMKLDLRAAADLIRFVPAERFVLIASGVETPVDVECMQRSGARALLVSQALLKADDVAAALTRLRTGLGRQTSLASA